MLEGRRDPSKDDDYALPHPINHLARPEFPFSAVEAARTRERYRPVGSASER